MRNGEERKAQKNQNRFDRCRSAGAVCCNRQYAGNEYTGSAETMLVSAKVEVSVENHEIQSVKILEHQTGKGKPAEAIVDEIARQDSLDVDAVAGATYSSKVIRYAVYDALQKGKS